MPKKQLFSNHFALSLDECARICHKSRGTVTRWEREGWPKAYALLCELHANGRILPHKWAHARFNTKGNLQLHNGEVSEVDILNQPYVRLLNAKMRREFELLLEENRQLRKHINKIDFGAANDYFLA